MNRIIVLPSGISQKIAAGEVIERPFSVVKELVENSLDAHASEIKVELQGGGKRLIRVTDDGQGMIREDASLCFERHSTSKISKEEDLNQIATLGFRGEALPSISAVSRLTLKTCRKKGEKGTLIEREGEEVLGIRDVGFPPGTSVEVRDLFFNLPARRKFLRSERSELNAVVKYLTGVSLAFFKVSFSLTHGKREIFNYPQVSSLKERIFQIYGKSMLERLMEVEYEEGNKRVYGYASSPPSGRSDRTHQLFYVNNRPVRDKLLQAALNQVFRGFLEKDRFAEAFLFLFCPYTEVDINVHPAKAEVRFKDSQDIFRVVQNSIKKAMLKSQGIKEVYPTPEKEEKISRIEEAQPSFHMEIRKDKTVPGQHLFPHQAEQQRIHPRVLGQYLDMYIVASSPEGLLVIDQHNAHERVLFEKYEQIDKDKKWPRKLALFPILLELSPSQVLCLEDNQSLLEEAGFRVEAMGGRSFSLKEFPDIFKEEEAKDIFLSLLEEIKKEKIEDRRKKLLAALACKTAVKAGEVLSFDKMNYLVENLFQTKNSSLCPHGRPITVRIERRDIEKGLRRH
ncbi:MAG: DNA mismatch repair endonuclease MutL [Candidatus Aminicenantes bacterium]